MNINWVVGEPIQHSMSPLLHAALYKHLGISAKMEAKSYIDPEKLISDIRKNKIPLTAVTMPLKQSVVNYLDQLDATAKKTGVVNTIIQTDGQLTGYNTDLDGIDYSFQNIVLKNQSVFILGAGAVSKLMGLYLAPHTPNIYWHNRNYAKAQALSATYGGKAISSLDEILDLKIDLLINTTPIGMLALPGIPINPAWIHPNQTVFDVIYNPLKTPLIKAAEASGASVLPGITMFVAQAIKQIALWQKKTLLTNELFNLAKTILINELKK